MVALPAGVEDLVPAYLARQRWYAARSIEGPPAEHEVELPADVSVESARPLWEAPASGAKLWQAVVLTGGARYQLVFGERPVDRSGDLPMVHDAVLGVAGSKLFFDVSLDSELGVVLLAVASGATETADRARPLSAEQTNTSLVYDDRLILKLFRRLLEGPNPEVEVVTALADSGFQHVAEPMVTWREGPYDLAFGQRFLAGGTEGWALALTSLRDFYNALSEDPSEAGGDFASEAGRIGTLTAEMHLAMLGVFGLAPASATRKTWEDLIAEIESGLAEASPLSERDLVASGADLLQRLRAVGDPGAALRVHGDFHLGQVMRTDEGWFVHDFEGEPERPRDERVAPASPLKDIAGMLRSFQYAARYVLGERSEDERQHLETRAMAWEARSRQAFLEGYRKVTGIRRLLPPPGSLPAVLVAYEIDKSLYELAYERAHRPGWVHIPLDATIRLIGGNAGDRSGGRER